jgi:hypothetical protein
MATSGGVGRFFEREASIFRVRFIDGVEKADRGFFCVFLLESRVFKC